MTESGIKLISNKLVEDWQDGTRVVVGELHWDREAQEYFFMANVDYHPEQGTLMLNASDLKRISDIMIEKNTNP